MDFTEIGRYDGRLSWTCDHIHWETLTAVLSLLSLLPGSLCYRSIILYILLQTLKCLSASCKLFQIQDMVMFILEFR